MVIAVVAACACWRSGHARARCAPSRHASDRRLEIVLQRVSGHLAGDLQASPRRSTASSPRERERRSPCRSTSTRSSTPSSPKPPPGPGPTPSCSASRAPAGVWSSRRSARKRRPTSRSAHALPPQTVPCCDDRVDIQRRRRARRRPFRRARNSRRHAGVPGAVVVFATSRARFGRSTRRRCTCCLPGSRHGLVTPADSQRSRPGCLSIPRQVFPTAAATRSSSSEVAGAQRTGHPLSVVLVGIKATDTATTAGGTPGSSRSPGCSSE